MNTRAPSGRTTVAGGLYRLLLTLIALLASATVAADWHQESQAVMGTRVTVEAFFADDAQAAEVMATVMAEMHRIDHAFSPYKEHSELSRLNREAGQAWVPVSDELFDLLDKSTRISQLSGGAFDITYASAGRYYDYREGKIPDAQTLDQAVQAIDYRHVQLDAQRKRVRFQHPAVYVDLGGIAKGHAVDRGIHLLEEAGVQQASVAAGGDSRIIGDRNGEPWSVGIAHPRQAGEMSAILPLENTAVSTSGDYERFFERDGVRYHHILDPQTGRSADGAWSVTILGPEATFTDALSTTVFVLGPARGLALINQMPGVDAIIIDPTGELLFSDDLSELNAP
ncbi:MAG: FAD:protein FMN transferase [Pseudomonadota bacterium]